MPSQVITVDRKKYAVGLFWQPTGAGYVARAYARLLARSVDKKLNLYTEYRAMVGLGAKKFGHRVGMDSAAAAVTDALGEYTSFLAVFSADANFYLVAVRNGVILEDKLFEREEEARAEYYKLSEIPDWGALFAPGAWGMPRAVERNLSDLIMRGTKVTRAILHPISRLGAGITSAILMVAFGIAIAWFFRVPLEQMITPQPELSQVSPEVAAEYERQLEEKNKELDAQFEIQRAPQPEPIKLPYEYLPNPEKRAEVCFQAIAFLMQPITGWNQVSAECGESYASAVFNRDFGTLDDFYMIATELMPGSFVQKETDNSLYVRAKLPTVPIQASLDERDVETVTRAVLTAFQYANVSADVQMVVDTLTNGVDTVNLDVVEIAVQSKLNPMQFMKIFEDFGGVYMTRCAWDASARVWNYEVIIYAK